MSAAWTVWVYPIRWDVVRLRFLCLLHGLLRLRSERSLLGIFSSKKEGFFDRKWREEVNLCFVSTGRREATYAFAVSWRNHTDVNLHRFSTSLITSEEFRKQSLEQFHILSFLIQILQYLYEKSN
jgi:hypothetical protein